jgi:hypothetical protein
MRQVIASLLVIGSVSAPAIAFQARGAAAAGTPRIGACSLLTKELITKFETVHKKLVLLPPSEEPLGKNGSACDYGDFHFQVDPFARQEELRKNPGKDWKPLSGVGDTAWFHNNGDTYAELMVWTGSHHFTIQADVPLGGTAEAVKPNAVGLANAIVAKLK